jgi:hypothetical protein
MQVGAIVLTQHQLHASYWFFIRWTYFLPMQQNVQSMLQGQGFASPQCQMISLPNGYQTPNTRNQNVQRTPANQNVIQTPLDKKCYNFGQKGHFAITCPNPRSCPPLTLTPNSASPPNRDGISSPVQARQSYAEERVNQLAMKEAQNAPNEWYIPHQLEFRSNHFFDLLSFLL